MTDAVSIQGVSKIYRPGKVGTAYFFGELHEAVRNFLPGNNKGYLQQKEPRRITALDTVTLSVANGESVGIIGRNGSGKSTLLKLVAGITLPSIGTIELRGRVASLLDIGTGFQGDLSARENIFLNGAILGMTRQELQRRFSAIVGFSGIAGFLDTPVKRFSAGMYIRLAFSIAIHCVADILLIDEILAAADRRFLTQCRGKLKDLVASGTSLLLVSHNLKTIEELCPRAVLIENGRVAADGPVREVTGRYRSLSASPEKRTAENGVNDRVESERV